ncbi:hypothetical protein EV363DRAFT_1524557 [Boletus edulis]|nr:hypothetical protein EV363DRAFT_1524557 [Boletus edulis]
MPAEDPLFILYTSGSTRKPKGVVHTTAGYLLGAALTVKYVFDLHPDDKFACMADIGWITGHSYIVYGPLANGVTTTVFESTPIYPTPSRYWETVQSTNLHNATPLPRLSVFSVASGHTTLRATISALFVYCRGAHQSRSLELTETGSMSITPFPGAIETKAGSATVPFFGIKPAILDAVSGQAR